jgi:DNA-binding transcriptional LysR family regulator
LDAAPPDSQAGSLAANDFRAAGLNVPRTTVVTHTDIARLALVAKGRFLTIATRSTIGPAAIGHTAIKVLPIELAKAQGSLGIVTLKNRTLTPVAQLFIDCVREVARRRFSPGRSGRIKKK